MPCAILLANADNHIHQTMATSPNRPSSISTSHRPCSKATAISIMRSIICHHHSWHTSSIFVILHRSYAARLPPSIIRRSSSIIHTSSTHHPLPILHHPLPAIPSSIIIHCDSSESRPIGTNDLINQNRSPLLSLYHIPFASIVHRYPLASINTHEYTQ